MRVLLPLVALLGVMLALALGAPASASAACEGSSCGIPQCWSDVVRLRPDHTRTITISCFRANSATVKTAPQHSDISNVRVDWGGLHFEARPRDGAERFDEAVLEVMGPEGSIDLPLKLEVIPRSENTAPVCDGDRATKRSDGTGPVELFMHPYCRDYEGDEFVIEGGGPGVHPYAPKSVPAGSNDSNWTYRTATFAGEETTRIWATDMLGARSEDAKLEVTVGPNIDRLPTCTPSSWGSADAVHPVRSRPGATRRFAIRCEDLDGDSLNARLSSPPERGLMPLFVEVDSWNSSYWGAERWIDATYVPTDESLEPDPFTVIASAARGEGPANRFAITPVSPPENWGGGCGWSSASIISNVPGKLSANCDDSEGDPLSVEIVRAPRHGKAPVATITPGKYGSSDITIPYVPDPGYEGYDCVEIRVTDGHGSETKIAIDVWVAPPPPRYEPPVYLPPLPTLPTVPPLTGPDLTPKQVKGFAQHTLGTPDVKQVHAADGAQVWARSKLSRKELMRKGQLPGLVVVCSRSCKVRGDAALANGASVLRTSRRKSAATMRPGQPHVVALMLGAAERKALGRAKKPQARFNLSIRPGGGKTTALKRTIAVTR